MPKQHTYYCPTCDRELWPTRDERFWSCPDGHTKLLPEKVCDANHTMTKAQRLEWEERCRVSSEACKQKKAEAEARRKKEDEIRTELPVCGLEFRTGQRGFDIWWVMGREEKFGLVGNGLREGCVHAIDSANWSWGEGQKKRFRIVSLKPLSERQLLFRADLLVTGKKRR